MFCILLVFLPAPCMVLNGRGCLHPRVRLPAKVSALSLFWLLHRREADLRKGLPRRTWETDLCSRMLSTESRSSRFLVTGLGMLSLPTRNMLPEEPPLPSAHRLQHPSGFMDHRPGEEDQSHRARAEPEQPLPPPLPTLLPMKLCWLPQRSRWELFRPLHPPGS